MTGHIPIAQAAVLIKLWNIRPDCPEKGRKEDCVRILHFGWKAKSDIMEVVIVKSRVIWSRLRTTDGNEHSLYSNSTNKNHGPKVYAPPVVES